jgi:prolyl oligopeptidase
MLAALLLVARLLQTLSCPAGGESVQAVRAGTPDDVLHGVTVPDPFRWLEDDESPATREWLAAQQQLLAATLGPEAGRERIRRRLRELVAYDSIGTPVRAGDRYFYTRVKAGEPQSRRRIIVRERDGRERELAASFGDDSLPGRFAPAPDGATVAVVVTNPKAATWAIRFVRVSDGAVLEDRVEHRGAPTVPEWRRDSAGVYYAAATQTEGGVVSGYQLLSYRPGGRQPTIVGTVDAEPGLLVTPKVTSDGNYLVVTLQRGTEMKNRVRVLSLAEAGREPVDLVPAWQSAFTFLGAEANRFWFYTDDNAPRGRVVMIDLKAPERRRWREIVREQRDAISARDQTGVNPIGMYGGRLVLTYVRDGQPYLRVFTTHGAPTHTIELPRAGAIWNGFSGTASRPEVFFWFLGLTDPSTIYTLDTRRGTLAVFERPTVRFDRSRYVVKQDFYTSADGTRIPIFVAHRADVKPGEPRPTWLYGYGALGWVSFIWYQPHILAWLEMGGVYAQPGIRGGGEYGEEWHRAALQTKKHVAVDDYLAAAQWLIDNRYATGTRLVANGGSLSAPLAAAAVDRRPDLFGAVVIDRPVTDMVRFEKFTGGGFWTPEFGSVNDPAEFKSLLSLSAYHTAQKPACLLPTLVMAGDLDRTAPPLHARKLVAALQESQTCPNPVRLKMMPGATHNFGNSPEQQVDSFSDLLMFLSQLFKMSPD